jgi:hypothetical protein
MCTYLVLCSLTITVSVLMIDYSTSLEVEELRGLADVRY